MAVVLGRAEQLVPLVAPPEPSTTPVMLQAAPPTLHVAPVAFTSSVPVTGGALQAGLAGLPPGQLQALLVRADSMGAPSAYGVRAPSCIACVWVSHQHGIFKARL